MDQTRHPRTSKKCINPVAHGAWRTSTEARQNEANEGHHHGEVKRNVKGGKPAVM